MSVMLVAPGTPMAIGPGRLALGAPLSAAPAPTGQAAQGSTPAILPNLVGWWDASAPGGVEGATGSPLATWNGTVSAIIDKSASAKHLTPYAYAGGNPAPQIRPRLNGLLGGVGRVLNAASAMSPDLDPDLGFQLPVDLLASAGDWTFFLVWTRPNWRQQSGKDAQPIALLTIGQVPVLQADSQGGQNRLVLFPTSQAATVLTTGLARRHTHSIILRYSVQHGVDVWLDATKVATSAVSSLPATQSVPPLLLHDGSASGAAQCWFHEAAVWNGALVDTDIAALLTYAGRWARGSRRGITLLFNGQSNAINYALKDGAAKLLAQSVAWHIGAAAHNVVATTGGTISYTMQSGHGIYAAVNGTYPGSFLLDPNDGSDPQTWSLGQDGNAVAQALTTLPQEDRADICAIVWPWNETDSLRSYNEKATYASAARRFLSLVRGMLGGTPGELPLIWWNPIPYGAADGMQMIREVAAEAAKDSTQNVWIGNPQTSDSNPRGSVWDPATGIATGGDYGHRDSLDNQRFARLAAPIVARALLAANHADTIATLPPGFPQQGGPSIVHAYRKSDTSLILTIVHDAGTDLKLPLQASQGSGFAVMNGGSATNPGVLVSATSCTRVDATHLALSLAQPLTYASTACHLYYPYGAKSIYRGNAVTDNYSDITKPDGWDAANDLGTAWKLDFPLAAIFAPIPLSDTPL